MVGLAQTADAIVGQVNFISSVSHTRLPGISPTLLICAHSILKMIIKSELPELDIPKVCRYGQVTEKYI